MKQRFIDDYLLYLLARASTLVSGQFHTRLKPHGIDVAEWRILTTLSDGDGLTVGQLAEIVLFQQPTLTKIADRMEALGLVERQRDSKDRRIVRVFIKPAGREKVAGLMDDARRHEAEVLSDYTAAESAALKDMLRTLIDRQVPPRS